jgi:hypothetical protein
MNHEGLCRFVRTGTALGVAATALLAGAFPAGAATPPFTPGNLVVYRVGTGAAALSSAATPVFLDELTTAGTAVGSVPLPTTVSGSQKALTSSGSATSEGLLTRSADGRYIVLTGYNAAVGTASVASSASATVNRVIGRVAGDGTVDTSTALTDADTGNNVRSVASVDGSSFWVSGAADGIRYAATLGATTSTQLSTTVTNLRQTAIFSGPSYQLYVSTGSGSTLRVGTVGSGTPTTAGQTITGLPGFPVTGSPYAFNILDVDGNGAVDTLYVADDTAGQIQKYVLSGGSWTAKGAITASSGRGLVAAAVGGVVRLYATNGSALLGATDASGLGGTASGSVAILATAPANEAFRGVAFAPESAPVPTTPEAPWSALLPLAALAAMGGAFVAVRRRATV